MGAGDRGGQRLTHPGLEPHSCPGQCGSAFTVFVYWRSKLDFDGGVRRAVLAPHLENCSGGHLSPTVGLKTSQTCILLEAESRAHRRFGELSFSQCFSQGPYRLLSLDRDRVAALSRAICQPVCFVVVVWGVLALQPCKSKIKLSSLFIQINFVPGEVLG